MRSFLTKVECRTEDGVRVDAVGHLNLAITRPDGNTHATAVYRKPTQNRDGLVTFQPIANRYLEEAGQWSIICQYTEYRDRLKSALPPADHVTKSEPVRFAVQPGKYLLTVTKYKFDIFGLKFTSGKYCMVNSITRKHC